MTEIIHRGRQVLVEPSAPATDFVELPPELARLILARIEARGWTVTQAADWIGVPRLVLERIADDMRQVRTKDAARLEAWALGAGGRGG